VRRGVAQPGGSLAGWGGAVARRSGPSCSGLSATATIPDKKPAVFNFNNLELEEELSPLFIKANTWAEFFDSIDKKYGKKKCSVVYPWIINAMYIIFEGDNIFDNYKWVINLDRLPLIPFKSYLQKGGVTRKKVSPNIPIVFLLDIPEVNSMNYRRFLHE
jgi:hypothetical protein